MIENNNQNSTTGSNNTKLENQDNFKQNSISKNNLTNEQKLEYLSKLIKKVEQELETNELKKIRK